MNRLLPKPQRSVLRTFHQYLMEPREMLCFWGAGWDKHHLALEELVEKELLVREKRPGAYSLTKAGFEMMRECERTGA
ncbi:hypothetical protein KOR34_37200 [Posidoniimonas corsicana]|uniref:ArnR1-like winged helix-turn-helix domain-containing protein n=1 Tax=Posidoniimonas corsicana TaxID=1938618 RepID=A0A5C5V5Q0_9BACT|nr:hypothetical protein KOR34_37200 [Posidoniimonas corsicana]